jgi:branched-chain amino acid transport system permease protein
MAIRDNRIAAESVGLNVTKYKLMAFVVSAALAGMAGALYAMNYSTVVPKKFDFNTSILVLVFVVLGGMGNIRGSIIAAAILTVLPELLRAVNDYRMLIYAIVLILVMLVTNNPTLKAVWTTVKEKLSFLSKKKSAIPEEGGADHE